MPAESSNAGASAFSAGYGSRCKLRGDFDLQMDFELLTWPTPANGVRVGFSHSVNAVERTSTGASEGGDDRYVTVFSGAYNSTPTSDLSGKLRFVRSGGTALAYYWRSGDWIQWSSGSITSDDFVWSIGAWSGDIYFGDKLVKIALDNVYVQGTLICPPSVDLKQTWGSGPIDAINPTGWQSDPVNSLTGNYVSSATDLSLPGIGTPFSLTRSYNSLDTRSGSLGRGWTHAYDVGAVVAQDGDVTVRSENGQRTLFEKEPDGSFIAASGALSKLTAVPDGFELVRQDQSRYKFDSSGKATRYVDRNGHGLTFSYDGSGNLATVTDSAGRAAVFTHNASNLLTQVALPDGRSVSYGYTNGLLTSVTDVRGGTTTYEYDASSRLTKITDQEGHAVIANAYGSDGRVSQQTDALGNTSTFSWDTATQTSTMTDARGNAWKDVYSDNVLIKRIDPLGNTTVFNRDAKLDLVSVTDPRGNATTMTYDSAHNMLTRTAPSPLSYQESFTYDPANNLASYTDGRGNSTSYGYDGSGNLATITAPGNTVTAYGRDPTTKLVTSVTDPRGKTTLFAYDVAGNLTEVSSPMGSKTTLDHDGSGRVTGIVEPRGNEPGATPTDFRTALSYDAANHLVALTDPLGNVTQWSYRLDGVLTSVKDAKNRTTGYGYDSNHRLVSVTAPDTSVTSYGYDATGNLTSRTDAKIHTTTYAYDTANRLKTITSPTSQVWSYAYDATGNVAEVVDAAGNQTTGDLTDGKTVMSYDVLNRLVGLDYSDTTPDVSYGYDANSNRVSMTDTFGTESYSHDALDRVIEVARGSSAFAYAYDPTSNVTRRTYPDGTVIDYTYDDDSRLASVTSGAAATTYTYDAAANLLKTTLPTTNGHVETRTYDRAGRLSEIANKGPLAMLSFARYVRDEVGNPTEMTTAKGSTTYAYDELDRLSEVCFPLGCTDPANPDFIRYTYDKVGNRLSEARPLGTTTYDYNAADQLLSRGGPDGTTTYDHDPNGNLTRAGTTTYTYDLANRMSSLTQDVKTTTYSHDGDGKRLRASSGTGTNDQVKYRWDTNAPLALLATERDGADSLLRRYVYGNDLIAMTSGGNDSYYHYDGIGSVTNVTDATGLPQWSYSYDAFGNSRSATKLNPLSADNHMRFTGEYQDPTGLYHLRARQYDPDLARFTATDPVSPKLHRSYISAYAYADNRPTVLIDPSGLTACGNTSSGDIIYDLSDSFAAFGDWLTFGLTERARTELGVNECVNQESTAYTAFTSATCGDGMLGDSVRALSVVDEPAKPLIINGTTWSWRYVGLRHFEEMTRAGPGMRNLARAPFRASLFVSGAATFSGLACKRYP